MAGRDYSGPIYSDGEMQTTVVKQRTAMSRVNSSAHLSWRRSEGVERRTCEDAALPENFNGLFIGHLVVLIDWLSLLEFFYRFFFFKFKFFLSLPWLFFSTALAPPLLFLF